MKDPKLMTVKDYEDLFHKPIKLIIQNNKEEREEVIETKIISLTLPFGTDNYPRNIIIENQDGTQRELIFNQIKSYELIDK